MYSFEGKFRTTPTVSLGGRSKQDKLDKERLLQKAQKERQKREEVRHRLHSALIIQSSVRSFLVRQKLKRHLRQQFDYERQQFSDVGEDVERLQTLSRWLKFFYNLKNDNDRLTWFGQQLLPCKQIWIRNDDENLLRTSGVLKLCCRYLSAVDSSSSIAIPLRVVETFTSEKLIANGQNLETAAVRSRLLKLWDTLVKDGYFSSILHLLSTRVPGDIEPPHPDADPRPPTPLAETLLFLLGRPVLAAGRISEIPSGENDMDTSGGRSESRDFKKVIRNFISEILCEYPSPQLYNYIYPALGQLPDLPLVAILETTTSMFVQLPEKPPGLLAALVKLVHPKLNSLSHVAFAGYLQCIQYLIVHLPRIRHESDGDISSDEDSDDDTAGTSMEYSSHNEKETSIPLSQLVSECHLALTSLRFIDACIGRKIHEHHDSSSLDTICAICHHLIAVTRVTVQKNRLLYTLAFSSSFLRKLWRSAISTSTTNRSTGTSVPLVQLLCEGSHMTDEETSLIRSKLVVFCALFNHNLLSVHDTDFYDRNQSRNRHMAFTTSELVSIALTVRDVCIALIKRALPETRSRLASFNIRNVLHALSFGQPVVLEKVRMNKDAELEMRDINDAVFLFTVCRRLVKHLHTRDERRSFVPKNVWLSNSILVKTDQSNDFAHRWHRRSESNSAVAAHLSNMSDEGVILSITEARQLAVLMNIPFVIPFNTRVSIFMTMLRKDRESRETSTNGMFMGLGPSSSMNEVSVRRDFLYEDAFNDLSQENAPDLRRRLLVTFVNSLGLNEAGLGDGVTREFMQQIVKTGFDPKRGVFKTTEQGRLYPNPHAMAIIPNAEKHFHFLGRLLGKVVYEGMQVELPFASFFLCKILQRKNTDVDINHLQSLDPGFYKNLMYLHDYSGDISDLDLNFTVVDESLGVVKVNELIPDGKNTPVTNSNKVLYMHLMANYKLNVQMRFPCLHFRRGLESVVTVDWLQMFDHKEFQTLVAGAEVPIDIEDLKRHSAYSGGYTADHPTIKAFWEVLSQLSNSQLSQLLLFVTSCSRPPLLGFKELFPPFCIQRAGSEKRLPTASTCMNLLKLPEYTDAETMKSKLLYSLQSGSGFELS